MTFASYPLQGDRILCQFKLGRNSGYKAFRVATMCGFSWFVRT